jgi:hypothetical protein
MKKFCNPLSLHCAPTYVEHSSQEQWRYLIMQYIDDDLVDYICNIPIGYARDEAIKRMGLEMLDAIELMHK